MKRFFLVTIGLLIAATRVCAQYDPSFAHYWAMEPSFNPAAVGKESKLNVAGAYSLQLAGFEHNPKTMYVAADMPFYAIGSYHGVGSVNAFPPVPVTSPPLDVIILLPKQLLSSITATAHSPISFFIYIPYLL